MELKEKRGKELLCFQNLHHSLSVNCTGQEKFIVDEAGDVL